MSDLEHMEMALQLAKSVEGQTSPNPVVGAVVVRDGQVVGFGAHLKAGEGHAEVHAINMAGEKAKGSTIYVTLEPCSHYGRTPPCSRLLIQSGVKRVVIATTDPNPKVAGKGITQLKNAGIEVEVGLLKEKADKYNEVFFHYIQTGQPFVTLKSAVSLDGKIATTSGESKWITSEEARLDVHHYRHIHDAILVGVNTVLKDNPSLTTRLPNGGKNPIRVILDHHLRTPLEANVVTDRIAPTWIVTSKHAPIEKIDELQGRGINVLKLEDEKIQVPTLLSLLGKHEVTSLFVEGGSEINSSFLKSRHINQVITYVAPKLIGGKNAPTAFGGEGFSNMKDIMSLEIKDVVKIGSDLKIISVPTKEG